ncbi:hypothetical protein PVL29_012013 [Vitis rotundifolia]|uniref:Uncharacterized protein n=1 Tax=Vitis rotundifolia TaxID=103349 RepID=A0AA39DQ67_VITRO|nr:hypothetical protein PVL29_012013 [Vitis rotundifolia]
MSPILQYSPEYDLLSGTRPDTILSVVDSAVLGRIDFPSVCYSSVLTQIRSLLRYSPEYDLFSGTRPDNIISVLDSPRLAWIRFPVCLVFYDTCPDILAWIPSFLSWIPRYSHGLIPRLSVILRYSPEYDLFSNTHSNTIISILDSPVLARIRFLNSLVFSDTPPDSISFLVMARIGCFLSFILWYSYGFDSSSISYSLVLARIRFPLRYSHRFNLRLSVTLRYSPEYDLFSANRPDTIIFVLDSPVLARIRFRVCLDAFFLLFSGTRTDSILRLSPIPRYSPEYDLLSGTRSDTILSVLDSAVLRWIDSPSVCYSLVLARIRSLLRYSPRYHHFCLGFSGTHTDSIPCLSGILRYLLG